MHARGRSWAQLWNANAGVVTCRRLEDVVVVLLIVVVVIIPDVVLIDIIVVNVGIIGM